MKEQIEVLRKRPRRDWEKVTLENTLEALQHEVMGCIECVTFAEDACVICHEEGRILGLEPNYAFGVDWAGTILVVGIDGEDFTDVPEAAVAMAMEGRI